MLFSTGHIVEFGLTYIQSSSALARCPCGAGGSVLEGLWQMEIPASHKHTWEENCPFPPTLQRQILHRKDLPVAHPEISFSLLSLLAPSPAPLTLQGKLVPLLANSRPQSAASSPALTQPPFPPEHILPSSTHGICAHCHPFLNFPL